jgi:hypothetical protein
MCGNCDTETNGSVNTSWFTDPIISHMLDAPWPRPIHEKWLAHRFDARAYGT